MKKARVKITGHGNAEATIPAINFLDSKQKGQYCL